MGTRTTLQPVFESVKTDHTGTVHGSVPHRHSSSKVSSVLLCSFSCQLTAVAGLQKARLSEARTVTLLLHESATPLCVAEPMLCAICQSAQFAKIRCALLKLHKPTIQISDLNPNLTWILTSTLTLIRTVATLRSVLCKLCRLTLCTHRLNYSCPAAVAGCG